MLIGEAAGSPAAADLKRSLSLAFLHASFRQEDLKVSYSALFNLGKGENMLCSSPGSFKIYIAKKSSCEVLPHQLYLFFPDLCRSCALFR